MLGIICGGGSYPKLIAGECIKNHSPFCLLFIKGFVEQSDFSDICNAQNVPTLSVNFGEIQKMLNFFNENKVDKVTFAGKVHRPKFDELSFDKKGRAWLLKLGKSLFKGDDCLLRHIITLFEQEGFQIVSGTDLLKNIFLSEGVYSQKHPTQKEFKDIDFGFEQAKNFGKEDIGQSIVVMNGEVIRKEDITGTDNLIIESGKFSGSGAILIKISKPQQDLRIDLPTVGPNTIKLLHQYGFKGLVIEAGKCIVIAQEETINLADQYGLFLVSYSSEKNSKKKIFISAGEASGDYIGGQLMQNIRTLIPEKNVEFFGIGGANMCANGLKLLFPISELSIIGILEVIGKIFHVKRLIRSTVQAILDYKPDVVITIDSSGFHHRIDKILKKRKFGSPIVHYVAPPVWAWRKWRAKSLHRFIDKLMVMLPFEKDIFEKYNVNTVFVGHPIATDPDFDMPDQLFLQNFKKAHKIDGDSDLIITLLPGSRLSELYKHLPILQNFVSLMHARYGNLKIIMPTLPALRDFLQKSTSNWCVRPVIITSKSEKILGYYSSKLAIVASGTATLELARVGLPSIVIYRTSYLTYRVVKFLLRIPYVCLINIIEKRKIVPELLQKECTPENIFRQTELLLKPGSADIQKCAYADVIKKLSVDKFTAAKEIIKLTF